jgi:hypothetical protein
MIEPLLEAERAMSFGLIDQAERLYRQVADHDPRNSIAVVGLARVALERGDERVAYVEAKRATEIDPENPAAQHLVMRLTEVFAARGESLPGVVAPPPAASSPASEPVAPAPEPAAPAPEPAAPEPEPVTAAPAPTQPPDAEPATAPRPRKRRGFIDRLLGRRT